jgi:hypothetical protein
MALWCSVKKATVVKERNYGDTELLASRIKGGQQVV